jgi:haloacetate dehalogenase
MEIMPGFTLTDIETSGARIRLRHGGSGPPLLLLHGNPLTHVAWHKVAARLAERFHVVAADLRGYGDSSAPPEEPNSANYSFRAMAQDQVEVLPLTVQGCTITFRDQTPSRDPKRQHHHRAKRAAKTSPR